MGFGFGLLYIPSIALISRSFVRKRAVALGFATSGAPTGGIIYTVMFDQLISKLSFAWTVRVMAFVMLSLFVIAAILLVTPGRGATTITNDQRKKLIDIRALRDLPFWSFTAANFLLYLGYITPFYYIPTYAQTKLGTSRSMASYVLIISQACSIIGRVGTTICAHYFGSMVSWIFCGILSGILCFAWISADTLVRFILFAAFYGKSELMSWIISILTLDFSNRGYLRRLDSSPAKCILPRLSRRTNSWHLAWNGSKYQQLRITLGATYCRCARFGWLSW